MQSRNLMAGLFLTAVVVVTSAAFVVAKDQRTDDQALIYYKNLNNKIPAMQFPKRDIRHRLIPQFDILIVMPSCKSCSDFRVKSKEYMSRQQNAVFLIATPDLKNLEDITRENNYYVVVFDEKSNLANLSPGVYRR